MFKHGCRYDEAEAEVAGYKIPLGIAILGLVAAARGECEGGNQEEEKFCLVHIACDFIIWGSVSTKADNCPNERDFIIYCVRFVRRGYPYSGFVLH